MLAGGGGVGAAGVLPPQALVNRARARANGISFVVGVIVIG
jgi:hypothetical protein